MGYGLNHDQVELMKGPTLSSSLPVVFENSEKIDGIVAAIMAVAFLVALTLRDTNKHSLITED